MSYENVQKLGQTYNTLTLISTKGEDTIRMGECLKTLKDLYYIFKASYEAMEQEKREDENNNEGVE